MPTRLEPTPEGLPPEPATGGAWRRDEDGGLTPLDEPTATAAGLQWPATTEPNATKE